MWRGFLFGLFWGKEKLFNKNTLFSRGLLNANKFTTCKYRQCASLAIYWNSQ